jgi:membrane-associated phospholipid phosphatase
MTPMGSSAQSKKKKDSKGRIDDRFLNLARLLPIIYLVALCIFCLVYNIFPGPDLLVLCFFIYAAFAKRAQRFLKDWIPFLALFFAYEAMRGIAYNIAGEVHVAELINAELQIFGTIPTLVLQHLYESPILDWIGAFFYSLHFLIPTVFGFILWHRSRENYSKYIIALLLCSYSALITVLLFPSAPPWFGVKADRILFHIDHEMGVPFYATLFALIEPNPFAAFPSLHATYPWLVSLYSIKIKRIKALPILILPLGIWFSAVYLGEHYVIDILAGVAYSTAAFFLVEKLITRFSLRGPSLQVFKKALNGLSSKIR